MTRTLPQSDVEEPRRRDSASEVVDEALSKLVKQSGSHEGRLLVGKAWGSLWDARRLP
jgi:hypothetical protein